MRWGILQRTIFMELVRVFLMSLVALTGILLLGGIFAEATQRGLSPAQVLAVIPLLIPNTLPYTLPTTTLFATCVIYGRLAHDNEILAIKAAGINILHIVMPAVVLGVLASAATFVLYMDLIPSTHNILRTQIVKDVEEWLYIILKRDGKFCSDKVDYEIYARRVENRTLIETEFRRRDAKTKMYDLIVYSREAELHVDLAKRELKVSMHNYHVTGGAKADDFSDSSETRYWTVDLPDMSHKSTRPSQTRWLKLFEKEQEYRQKQQEMGRELDSLQQSAADPGAISGKQAELRQLHIDLSNVIAEYHLRPALAMGCLCFVLVGCPIGIWFSKSDYLSAFITCFMPIVVIYYPLLLCGINMGKSGSVYPGATIWVANILMSITALFLFRKLLKN